MGRPQSVRPLIESFEASGAPGRVLFVVHEGDTDERKSIEECGGEYVLVADDLRGFVPKITNEGYRHTDEPWVLLGADDVRFHAGWWEATESLRMADYGVIGTNDLGNPRVIAGNFSTHPMLSRDYIEKCGTVDGSGILHEGYRHLYADDELIATAIVRDAWAFCRESVVEHLHPCWGKSEMDETYRLADVHHQSDAETWMRRHARYFC